jgi:hypothetical protein
MRTTHERKFNDLTGQKFGRWTVVRFHSREGECTYRWVCRCECGVERPVLYATLTRGASQSCGCLRRERQQVRNTGYLSQRHARTYRIWLGMKTRCLNAKHSTFKNYGKRGIEICPQWLKFEVFLKDMGEAPVGLSLERMDNDGHYEPANCKWATCFEQGSNTRHNVWLEWKGRRMIMTEVARMENVRLCSFRNYMAAGRSVEEAVATCRARGLTWRERAKTTRE